MIYYLDIAIVGMVVRAVHAPAAESSGALLEFLNGQLTGEACLSVLRVDALI